MRTIQLCAALALFGCSSTTPAPKPPGDPAPKPRIVELQAAEKNPVTTDGDEPARNEATAAALTRQLPTECASDDPCLPPRTFAESMCKGKYPELALTMFEKSTPWQRKWVNVRSLEAVNAFGGSNSGGDLTFGEEVLLLRSHQASSGGMQVSGGEDVEVLRWNGTCVTVRESELVEYVPGVPKHAPIVWNYLGDETQAALMKNQRITTTRSRWRQECRGSARRNQGPSCEKAALALGGAIVVAVRRGMELPMPEKRPEWAGLAKTDSVAIADSQ